MRYGFLGGRLNQIFRKCAADPDLRRKRLAEIGLYANRLMSHLLEVDQEALLRADGPDGDDDEAVEEGPHEGDEGEGMEQRVEEKFYADGCPREKMGGSASSPSAVLKRMALIQRVRPHSLQRSHSLPRLLCIRLVSSLSPYHLHYRAKWTQISPSHRSPALVSPFTANMFPKLDWMQPISIDP